MDMSPAELWAHIRIFASIDAEASARSVNDAALGARGTSQQINRHFAALGVKADG